MLHSQLVLDLFNEIVAVNTFITKANLDCVWVDLNFKVMDLKYFDSKFIIYKISWLDTFYTYDHLKL